MKPSIARSHTKPRFEKRGITLTGGRMRLPIYECSNCKQLQGYTGKGIPHCGMCGTELNEKDIIDYIEVNT